MLEFIKKLRTEIIRNVPKSDWKAKILDEIDAFLEGKEQSNLAQ